MSSLTINDVVQPISSKRRNKEKLFEIYGIVAILFAISMLLILFASIFSKGYSAFFQTRIILDIELQEQVVDPDGARNIDVIRGANYTKLINNSLYDIMDIDSSHPKAKEISSISTYNNMLLIRDYVVSNPDQIGTIKKFNLIASDDVDQYIKGNITVTGISENNRKISNFQVDAIKKLESNGNVLKVFNKTFFTKWHLFNKDFFSICTYFSSIVYDIHRKFNYTLVYFCFWRIRYRWLWFGCKI